MEELTKKIINKLWQEFECSLHINLRGIRDVRAEAMPLLIEYQTKGGTWENLLEVIPAEMKDMQVMRQLRLFLTDEKTRDEVLRQWQLYKTKLGVK